MTQNQQDMGPVRYMFSLGSTSPIQAILIIILLVVFYMVINANVKDIVNENQLQVDTMKGRLAAMEKQVKALANTPGDGDAGFVLNLPAPPFASLGSLFAVIGLEAEKNGKTVTLKGELVNLSAIAFKDLTFNVGDGTFTLPALSTAEARNFSVSFNCDKDLPKAVSFKLKSAKISYQQPAEASWGN